MRPRSKWLIRGGAALVTCSLVLVLVGQIVENRAQKQAAAMAAHLKEILPSATVGVQDTYSSMQMPSLEIDSKNIIGLLEIPAWEVSLPIGSSWDRRLLTTFPQRFSGTVYDGSLIVGGRDGAGQLDCLKKLDIGDVITVTDMTGARFTYAVDRVERKSSAAAEVLQDDTSDLTLFARGEYSLEYVVVRCKQSHG